MLLGPTAHVDVAHFPAGIRMSVFAEFTGGHGSYRPGLSLRDGGGQVVWSWPSAEPFTHGDPLLPSEVVLNDILVAVPRPGRYTLALLLNDEQAAERSLWFGPRKVFAPPR